MTEQEAYKQLTKLLKPHELCMYVFRKTKQGKDCDSTFRYAQEFLKQYYPDVAWSDVQPLLETFGQCDCEIGFNLCSQLSRLSAQA